MYVRSRPFPLGGVHAEPTRELAVDWEPLLCCLVRKRGASWRIAGPYRPASWLVGWLESPISSMSACALADCWTLPACQLVGWMVGITDLVDVCLRAGGSETVLVWIASVSRVSILSDWYTCACRIMAILCMHIQSFPARSPPFPGEGKK